jgi:hypothetical protein
MSYTTDIITRETTFFLQEYAGKHNGYHNEKLYPSNHKLIIVDDISHKYKAYAITLSQLLTFLKYAEMHPDMGSALDSVHRSAPETMHKENPSK